MALNRRALTMQIGGLGCAVALAVGLQAHEGRRAAPESVYPYVLADSVHGGCGYDYIDLDDVGTALPLAPAIAGADVDDGAAVLALRKPFELYQSSGDALVVSGNGYLAATGSLADDDGTDFTNDCPLPEAPDNPRHDVNRIYVYHDDLRPQAGGGVRQAFFAHCPRPSTAGIDEACTVVEWNRFERVAPLPSSRPLQAQAVLYHRTHEIALQYASVDDSRASSATIGLQGLDGGAARKASCNVEVRTLPRSAVCFFDPRGRRGDSVGSP